jgi:hypothetical protein
MIDNPYETVSDSFYFINNRLIMHNKASYKYFREDAAQEKKSYEAKYGSKVSESMLIMWCWLTPHSFLSAIFLGSYGRTAASQSAKIGAKGSKTGSKAVAGAEEEAYLDEPADAKTTAADGTGVKLVPGAKVRSRHYVVACSC